MKILLLFQTLQIREQLMQIQMEEYSREELLARLDLTLIFVMHTMKGI